MNCILIAGTAETAPKKEPISNCHATGIIKETDMNIKISGNVKHELTKEYRAKTFRTNAAPTLKFISHRTAIHKTLQPSTISWDVTEFSTGFQMISNVSTRALAESALDEMIDGRGVDNVKNRVAHLISKFGVANE